ncbi:MAG: hypothetical protein K1X79_08805 [Oligoflexia bacterium]|nr:hypothetical protein [Oligoflexia bacterium]
MTLEVRQRYLEALQLMLKPALRFCLRHSISVQEIYEATKKVFVEVAKEDLERRGHKINSSRLCAATGLHRAEILRVLGGETAERPLGYITRIIGQWQIDRRFTTSNGKPRVLSCETDDSEFSDLVRSVVTDIRPGTLLFELERLGIVTKTTKGVRLDMKAYVPKDNPAEGFKLFAKDMAHLMSSIEENIYEQPHPPNHHLRTEFDNLRLDAVPALRKFLYNEGERFHRKLRKFLGRYDLDVTPKTGQVGGVGAIFASFSRLMLPEVKPQSVDKEL